MTAAALSHRPARAAAQPAATPEIERWGSACIVVMLVVWIGGAMFGFQRALMASVAFGFLLAALGLLRPTIGVLGIGILSTLDAPARVFLYTTGVLPWNTLNFWLLVVMLLSVPFLLRLSDPHSRLLQLMLALLAIGLVQTADFMGGVQHLLTAVVVFGLVVYFAFVVEVPGVWYWLAVVCAWTSLLEGLTFLMQQQALPYINPNAWSHTPLCALFATVFGFCDRPRRSGQLLLGLLGSANLALIFLSGSRGNLLIGLAWAVFVLAAVRGTEVRLALLGIGVTIAFALALKFGALEAGSLHRVQRLLDPTVSLVGRTSGRSDLILGGWYIFTDHPLGVGTGGFADAWAQLGVREGLSGFRQGEAFPAHAGWIKILAENGFPGIVLLTAFAASYWWVGRRRGAREERRLGLFTTVALSLAFLTTEFQAKSIWFLAAGALVLLHCERVMRCRSGDS